MSMAKAFGAPVVVTLANGESVRFPLLKMKQLAELCAVATAEREAAANKIATESGLAGEARAKFRAMVDAETVDLDKLAAWSQTPAGANAILEKSLTGHPDAQAIMEGITLTAACDVAFLVLGFTVRKPEASQTTNPPKSVEGSNGNGTDGSSSTSTTATPST